MIPVWWSVLLTAVGVAGFLLAGKKVWWAWYVNIACQALWVAYAIRTEQWGFIAAAAIYTAVFTKNAIAWTREHHAATPTLKPRPARRGCLDCPLRSDHWCVDNCTHEVDW